MRGVKILDNDFLSIKIGIIGGGQLGKMMILEAKKLGFYIITLDPVENCPSHSISDEHIIADFNDESAIRLLASKCDVITYEFEHINSDVLSSLENEGYKIYPTAKSLQIIQNKFTQKKALRNGNIPVPDFVCINSTDDMIKAGKAFGYPYILKTCTGGYDGKGNAVVESVETITSAFEKLGSGSLPLMAERMVDFKMETSVLACRALNGDIKVYPVGDNRHINSILHETVVPADIKDSAKQKAMKLANDVMEVFKGIGMFCIEMFITNDDDVLVNEVAPRPHNSGHYSIEACTASQFENHIRAITGLPLGDTKLISPAVMINLLGSEGYKGKTLVTGLYDALNIDGVSVHIYGKENTSPNRKMGHITAVADTTESALFKARETYSKIKIVSKN